MAQVLSANEKRQGTGSAEGISFSGGLAAKEESVMWLAGWALGGAGALVEK
jgi:hypothetical protein